MTNKYNFYNGIEYKGIFRTSSIKNHYFHELFNEQLVKIATLQNDYCGSEQNPNSLKKSLQSAENSPFLLNFQLTIALMYAHQTDDRVLKKLIKNTLAILNRDSVLKDRYFILSATNPLIKQLFRDSKKLIKLYASNKNNVNFDDNCKNHFSNAFADITNKALEFAGTESDSFAVPSSSCLSNDGPTSDDAIKPQAAHQRKTRKKEMATSEEINAEITQLREENGQKLQQLRKKNNKLITSAFERAVKHPWWIKLEKTLFIKRLRLGFTQRRFAKTELTDALMLFYKFDKHEEIKELYQQLQLPVSPPGKNQSDYQKLVQEEIENPIKNPSLVFDKLFELFTDVQADVKNKNRTKTVKQLQKALKNAAEQFGYNFELRKNADGLYEKIAAKGQPINTFFARLGIHISNRALRRAAKEIARYLAIGIAAVVALGTAAGVFAAVLALSWPAFLPAFIVIALGYPLATLLFVASFSANFYLFKSSIYNMLNQFFIKRDIFKGLTPIKFLLLAGLTVCAILSSLAVGALTFSSMVTLSGAILTAIGLVAACPPILISIVAAGVAVAMIIATSALLFTTASNLIKQNFHLKIAKYFNDAFADLEKAWEQKNFLQILVYDIKILILPIVTIALIVVATYAMSSSLYASTTKLFQDLPKLMTIADSTKTFLQSVGSWIALACASATFGIRSAFIGKNVSTLSMDIGNGVKGIINSLAAKFSTTENDKLNQDNKKPTSAISAIKTFLQTLWKNPYHGTAKVAKIKEHAGHVLVIANAAGNMPLFHGGHSSIEQITPVISYVEACTSGTSSYAANRGSMQSAISEKAEGSSSTTILKRIEPRFKIIITSQSSQSTRDMQTGEHNYNPLFANSADKNPVPSKEPVRTSLTPLNNVAGIAAQTHDNLVNAFQAPGEPPPSPML